MFTQFVLSLIAAFGGFTQGLTGVGVITVALPLMALILDMGCLLSWKGIGL